jgi:hypothetical protein
MQTQAVEERDTQARRFEKESKGAVESLTKDLQEAEAKYVNSPHKMIHMRDVDILRLGWRAVMCRPPCVFFAAWLSMSVIPYLSIR